MKILHVIPTLDPAMGGPPMIAARLAAGQASLGHEVCMLTHHHPHRCEQIDLALKEVPFFDRVMIRQLRFPSRWEQIFGPGERAIIRTAIEDAHVVHIHSVWESILRIAAAQAKSLGRPYFVLLNGMLDPWSLQQSALKKKLALALGYRRMLDGASALHLGTADEKRLIQPLHLRASGVIIPNGVFLEELSPLPATGTFAAKHPPLAGRPYILFLARLHYKKGLDILPEAFARAARAHEDLQLVVAGPDEGSRQSFEADIHKLGIAHRVHIVGPLYGPDKLAAIRDAMCFCLPSHQEGFSLAVIESLGCGVPVVISEGCHFPEVAQAGAGEVLPRQAAVFGDALSRIAGDKSLRQRMSDSARELVEKNYTWPHIAQQTVDMYQRSLEASPGG